MALIGVSLMVIGFGFAIRMAANRRRVRAGGLEEIEVLPTDLAEGSHKLSLRSPRSPRTPTSPKPLALAKAKATQAARTVADELAKRTSKRGGAQRVRTTDDDDDDGDDDGDDAVPTLTDDKEHENDLD